MNTPLATPGLRAAGRTSLLAAAIGAALIAILVFSLRSGSDGMDFATKALAQSPAAPAATAAAPGVSLPAAPKADAATDQKKGTETQTLAAEPAVRSVFQADPLQSLADSLRRKEAELQTREDALKQKEQYLETIRLETQDTLKKIELVRKDMESKAADVDQQRQKQVKKWIDIFQKMTPEKVAPVLSGLDQDLQIELISQMDSGKAAKVLNSFPAEKASELSAKLKR